MNYISLIICLLLSITTSQAQNLKFDNPTWDFETITEEGGEVSHTFNFKNISSEPIVIINATTTCGCTVPQYSKKPIASGAESTIKITYDPMYRPGKFSREVKIYTSAASEPEVIKIIGDVTPRKKSVQEQYIYLLEGGVRISSLYAYLQNISPSSTRSSAFEVINTSNESRTITIKPEFPTPYLSYSNPAKALEPGESGVITVTYGVREGETFYGELVDNLKIYIDGQESKMTIQTRAYAVDDFNNTSKKGVARAEFSEKMITFEPFNISKSSMAKSFTIENIGTSPLLIRAIDAPQGVNFTTLDGKNPIGVETPAGKSMVLNVSLEPATQGANMLGDFAKSAIFILNDPEQPVVRLRVVGRGEK